ncbi:MAG: hypothetical protein EZS28_021952 [Streblomastix strix]|uniref:Dynein heavy chain ATP-binding dynein motor region domain-containing protein n=1 Tax=Streblomastix strix TaxID=222440 RepID=A0A5J4VIW2_9EUKA|nr:MAG: hypothetical protein EZS28_021952 [Streblomastix strix]
MSELKISLKETEETLLREITSVERSLHNNEELIGLLEKTKGFLLEATVKLERAKYIVRNRLMKLFQDIDQLQLVDLSYLSILDLGFCMFEARVVIDDGLGGGKETGIVEPVAEA